MEKIKPVARANLSRMEREFGGFLWLVIYDG
jgi:hypothetical protein